MRTSLVLCAASLVAAPLTAQPLTQWQRDSLSAVADTAKLESASAVVRGGVVRMAGTVGRSSLTQTREQYVPRMKHPSNTDVHVHPSQTPQRDTMIQVIIPDLLTKHKGIELFGAALYAHYAVDGHLSLPSPQDIRASQTKSVWLQRPVRSSVVSSFGSVDYVVLSADPALMKQYDLRRDEASAACVARRAGVGARDPEGAIASCIVNEIGTMPVRLGPLTVPSILLQYYPRSVKQ